MRKVSVRITRYVFLSASVVLFLGACMKPVDVKPFLESEEIRSKTGVSIDFGFDNPADYPPILRANIGGREVHVTADGILPVSLGSLDGVTITVTNAKVYDVIEWHYDLNPMAKGTAFTLRSAIFNVAGVYSVTVVGHKGDQRYSTLFYINVGS